MKHRHYIGPLSFAEAYIPLFNFEDAMHQDSTICRNSDVSEVLEQNSLHPHIDGEPFVDNAHLYDPDVFYNPPEGVSSAELIEAAKWKAAQQHGIGLIGVEERYGYIFIGDAADVTGPDPLEQTMYSLNVYGSISGHEFEAWANVDTFNVRVGEEHDPLADAKTQVRQMIKRRMEQVGLVFRPGDWKIQLFAKRPLRTAEKILQSPTPVDGVYREGYCYSDVYGDCYPYGVHDVMLVHVEGSTRYELPVESLADGLRLDPSQLPYTPGTRVCGNDRAAPRRAGEVNNEQGDIDPALPTLKADDQHPSARRTNGFTFMKFSEMTEPASQDRTIPKNDGPQEGAENAAVAMSRRQRKHALAEGESVYEDIEYTLDQFLKDRAALVEARATFRNEQEHDSGPRGSTSTMPLPEHFRERYGDTEEAYARAAIIDAADLTILSESRLLVELGLVQIDEVHILKDIYEALLAAPRFKTAAGIVLGGDLAARFRRVAEQAQAAGIIDADHSSHLRS